MTRLVLVGAGHAHALVLRGWADQPLAGVELAIVSPQPLAPYSGMVPAWLGGTLDFDALCIDFAALARAAGARLIVDEVLRLDTAQRQLHLRSGAVLGWDQLSLNIGSTLRPPALSGPRVLALRPLADLHQRWTALLAELADEARGAAANLPLRITAVGGGAAGVESLLAVCARLRALLPQRPLQPRLLARSARLLPGLAPGAARAALAALRRAGAEVQTNTDWHSADAADCDLVLWATGAQAHAWPGEAGLALGDGGFVQVDDRLRSVSHPRVHAAGDCAQWTPAQPKSGVLAVRMGPVLLHNLRAACGHGNARVWQPPPRTLALLNTADGRAIAAWGSLAVQGRWAMRWKDRIDRAFVAGFSAKADAPGPTPPAP